MKRIYVFSRNRTNRPNCIHRVESYSDTETACGVTMYEWSKEFMAYPIEILLCRKKACRL